MYYIIHSLVILITAVILAVTLAAAGPSSRDMAGSGRSDGSRFKAKTGCSAAGLCCQNKNNTCRASGLRMNQVDSNSAKIKVTKVKDSIDESTATCFCDSACLDLGDCCLDYTRTCPPVDCVLDNNWSAWSECDVRCGSGIKQRVKQVIQAPLNGGRPCPGNTVEKAVCEGTSCKIARAPQGHEELRETGKIIPAAYGPWRKNKIYNPYEDIRKNLFEHYENQTVFNRPSYCMQFELTEVRSACSKSSSVDENVDETWTQRLVKGTTICVECQSVAMRRQLGARCRGHGVMSKETRWSVVATTTGGCHGKWVMKSREQGCQCASDSPLSFILI